jgi:hypothetical protein
MQRTKTQNAQLHSLISKLGIDAEIKASLVMQFTNGRTSSSAEMDVTECQYLIGHLSALVHGKKMQDGRLKTEDRRPRSLSGVEVSSPSDKLRKKIISRFREMNYHTPQGKADMSRIQATVIKKWGKPLNSLTDAEMRSIIAVLEKEWLPHFYKKAVAHAKDQAQAQ